MRQKLMDQVTATRWWSTVAAVPRFILLHGFARAYQRRAQR